jgi:hypothetical protein
MVIVVDPIDAILMWTGKDSLLPKVIVGVTDPDPKAFSDIRRRVGETPTPVKTSFTYVPAGTHPPPGKVMDIPAANEADITDGSVPSIISEPETKVHGPFAFPVTGLALGAITSPTDRPSPATVLLPTNVTVTPVPGPLTAADKVNCEELSTDATVIPAGKKLPLPKFIGLTQPVPRAGLDIRICAGATPIPVITSATTVPPGAHPPPGKVIVIPAII